MMRLSAWRIALLSALGAWCLGVSVAAPRRHGGKASFSELESKTAGLRPGRSETLSVTLRNESGQPWPAGAYAAQVVVTQGKAVVHKTPPIPIRKGIPAGGEKELELRAQVPASASGTIAFQVLLLKGGKVVLKSGVLRRNLVPRPERTSGPWSFPRLASAPTTFEQAAAIPYLDPAGVEALRPRPPQWSVPGPDGGTLVYFTGGAFRWRWARDDGAQLDWQDERNWVMTFPDKTELRAKYNEPFKYLFFVHVDPAGGLRYEMHDARFWRAKTTGIGPYQFYYSPIWEPFVEAYRKTRKRTEFLEYVQGHYSFGRDHVPVLMFASPRDFDRYFSADDGFSADGFASVIGMGCDEMIWLKPPDVLLAPARDPLVLDAGLGKYGFFTLFHESVHNFQASRCDQRKGRNGGVGWFTEGLAEHLAMALEAQDRYMKYQGFFEGFIDKNVTPEAKALSEGHYKYSAGSMMVEYLGLRFGEGKVAEFNDQICRDSKTDFEKDLKQAFGMSTQEVFAATVDYFAAHRKKFEARFPGWQTDGLPTVPAKAGRRWPPRLPDPLPRRPRDLGAYSAIPDVWASSGLDLSRFSGKYEGILRGPAGEQVYLWKGGNYRITRGGYQIDVHPGNQAILTFKGHTIVTFLNGDRKWLFPDKGYAYGFRTKQMQYGRER